MTTARTTRQRTAIRAVIEQAGVPLSPREILDAAKHECEGLGLATVYRTLKVLTDEGAILPVDIPGESPRFELAGKGHHHHFSCRGCGKVFELEGCCGHFTELTPRGFVLEGHELTLYGKCDACNAADAKPATQGPKHNHHHAGGHHHAGAQPGKDHAKAGPGGKGRTAGGDVRSTAGKAGGRKPGTR